MLGWFRRKRSAARPLPERHEGRIFADYHQFHLLDGPDADFDLDTENWTKETTKRGHAGNPRYRMIGTQSQYQNHWVTIELSEQAPHLENFDRVIHFLFSCETGDAQIWETTGASHRLRMDLPVGRYDVHVCASNLGTEPEPVEPDGMWPELSDAKLAARTDLERYRIVFVPENT